MCSNMPQKMVLTTPPWPYRKTTQNRPKKSLKSYSKWSSNQFPKFSIINSTNIKMVKFSLNDMPNRIFNASTMFSSKNHEELPLKSPDLTLKWSSYHCWKFCSFPSSNLEFYTNVLSHFTLRDCEVLYPTIGGVHSKWLANPSLDIK